MTGLSAQEARRYRLHEDDRMHTTPSQIPTSNFAGKPALVADRIDVVEATIRVLQRLDSHEATHDEVAAELGIDVDAVTRHARPGMAW